MRKATVVTLAAAATLAAAPGLANAAPGDDLVAGSGQGLQDTPFGPLPSHVNIDAKGDAEDAHGHVFVHFGNGPDAVYLKNSVQCVNAVGNEAVLVVRVERTNQPTFPPGTLFFRKVIDNGQGAGDPPDQTGAAPAFFFPGFCPPPQALPIALRPIDQGNFVVHDGG
jgi:hypothetical protein